MENKRTWAVFGNGKVKDLGRKRSVSPGTFPAQWGDHFIMESETEPRGVTSDREDAGQGRSSGLLKAMKNNAHRFAANAEKQGDPWDRNKKPGYESCSDPWDCTKTIAKGMGKAVWRGLGGAQEAFDKAELTMETDPAFQKGVKNSRKYFGLGAAISLGTVGTAAAVTAAPQAVGTLLTNPALLREAGDFSQGLLDPGPPPPSKGGAMGYGARRVAEEAFRKK